MVYELSEIERGILCLRVVEASSLEEAKALNVTMSEDLTRRGWTRLLVDYRDMQRSDFDGNRARQILLQMDRMLSAKAAEGTSPTI